MTTWDPTCWGKEEFCLTKLQALRANSSPFAALRLIDVLNAFGLFALVERDRTRQASDTAYDFRVGSLRHFIGVRVGDEHLACLDALEHASGFTRGEIVRRLLLTAEIPSARALQEVQDLLRIQREQSRLGGLLKKALTEREEKATLRRTLAEIERNSTELRRVIAQLVRSR